MTCKLTEYEQQLKELYVQTEMVHKIANTKTYCSVLTLNNGFELAEVISNNAIDKNFTDEDMRDKALKNAYEHLEKFDRFLKHEHQ